MFRKFMLPEVSIQSVFNRLSRIYFIYILNIEEVTMDKTDTWVVCQYFSEDRYDEICPDDREKFLQLFPYQKVFHCIGKDDTFI